MSMTDLRTLEETVEEEGTHLLVFPNLAIFSRLLAFKRPNPRNPRLATHKAMEPKTSQSIPIKVSFIINVIFAYRLEIKASTKLELIRCQEDE